MRESKTNSKRKRRGRGEGAIYQRPDGRWVATVSLGYGANGKRKRRTVYGKSKQEAQTKLNKLTSSSMASTLVDIDKQTVAQFMDRWLRDVAKPTVGSNTYHSYSIANKNHVSKRIGGVRLQKLTASHIQWMFAEMAREGIGPPTRRVVHIVLNVALRHAMEQNLVVRNVCRLVKITKVPKPKIHPLDSRQVAVFLDAAKGDRYEALYHLAVGSGMRQGEIFGLHWADTDLVSGTVSVHQSLVGPLPSELRLGDVKTASGRRMIRLPQHVIRALEEHRRRMMADGFGGLEFVFCNRGGRFIRRGHFTRFEFKPLLKRAGLPSIRFHDLRHTHACLCLAAGQHPKVVQERLGHANIAMTMDTYSHVLPSIDAGTADKLDALVAGEMAELENGNTLATFRAKENHKTA